MPRRTRNVPNEAPGPLTEAEWRALLAAVDAGRLDPQDDDGPEND